MSKIDIVMPAMGEGVEEATVTNWLKKVGDTVKEDDTLVEIATDKVDSEINSTVSGVLVEIKIEPNQTVKVGEAVAVVETEGTVAAEPVVTPVVEQTTPPLAPEIEEEIEPIVSNPEPVEEKDLMPELHDTVVNTPMQTPAFSGEKITNSSVSPLVRSIARKENLSEQELATIPATGSNGRLTKQDVLKYVTQKKKAPKVATPKPQPTQPVAEEKVVEQKPVETPTPPPAEKIETPVVKETPKTPEMKSGEEIIPMGRVRKLIADNMVKSVQTAPHVTSVVEVDVTKIVHWRNRNKKAYQEKLGQKITFTPIFIQAVARAISEFPMINISTDGQNIIKKSGINISMAVAMESGDLILPVIKNANQYNLLGLTERINDLSARARKGDLEPSEIQNGTYTVTNIGTFGNIIGTPIIPQPQVAALAIGSISKVPAVVETPEGDFIAVKHKMYLSHSYDHRVVDGALGGMFVKRVADLLEEFDEKDVN